MLLSSASPPSHHNACGGQDDGEEKVCRICRTSDEVVLGEAGTKHKPPRCMHKRSNTTEDRRGDAPAILLLLSS